MGILSIFRRWLAVSANHTVEPDPEVKVEVTARFEREPISYAGARHPGQFYVYFHRDKEGNIFYVGKGVDDRAWRFGRGRIWEAYVDKYCGGEYDVEIVEEGLSEESALQVEAEHISRISKQTENRLVNRIFDPPDVDREKKALFENRQQINYTKVLELYGLEAQNIDDAIQGYRTALDDLYDFSSITYDESIIGQLRRELREGNLMLLDRSTICLMKVCRYTDAVTTIEAYQKHFPLALKDSSNASSQRRSNAINRRFVRAKKKLDSNSA